LRSCRIPPGAARFGQPHPDSRLRSPRPQPVGAPAGGAMDGREYRKAVRSQAWSDARAVDTHVHIAWGIGPSLLGAVVGFARERAMGVALSSFSGWLTPLLDGVVTLALWLVAVAIYFYLKGARGLYLASQEKLSAMAAALAEARVNIETAQDEHHREIKAIRQEHTNAIQALKREYESAVLTVTASTERLSQVWEASHQSVARIEAGRHHRRFGVLRVSNEGRNNLPGIVATCQFADDSYECVWSLETGAIFVSGGRNTADLNVGETRLLVIAQWFGEERLWMRLPPADRLHELPLMGLDGVFINRSREKAVMNLGVDVTVSVRMKGSGVDQTKHFRLWCNQDEPAIDILEPPPADPPSPKASA
jgi:hypothetical protein